MTKKIKSYISALLLWRQMLIKDLCLSAAEAICILILSNLPFVYLAFKYVLATKDAKLNIATIIFVIVNNVKPAEILGYIAAILASTTIYFFFRMKFVVSHFGSALLITICAVGPLTLMFLATPVYLADRYEKVENIEFVYEFSVILLYLSIGIWIVSMFFQRRMENQTISLNTDAGAAAIVKEVGGD